MKKFISCVLVLVLCLSLFAGCDKKEAAPQNPLAEAKDYLYNTYKNSATSYIADYKVIGKVVVGDKTYTVTWTTDAAEENVKIVPGTDGLVTIDINEKNPEEVTYKLTATITDENGKTETVVLERRTPAAIIIDEGMSYEQIVDAAYKLEDGLSLDGTYRLFGTITKIDTPYSPDYKNITVTIQIGDLADKPIMCYRLKGDGAADLKVGDKITVEGKIKNYKGTIEFDAGCELLSNGFDAKDQTGLLDASYALEDGMKLPEPITMYGVITKIDTPYSPDYKNITVTINCGDETRPIMCYRLKGEGAEGLKVGDTIVVSGTMKNYKGTIEFDAGCTLDLLIPAPGEEPVAPSDPKLIVDAAFALEAGGSLPYSATLTGTITEITTPYSPDYKNITVVISVEGSDGTKSLTCFRLKGDNAENLAVGDTITVTGSLMNYNGSVQFGSGCKLG